MNLLPASRSDRTKVRTTRKTGGLLSPIRACYSLAPKGAGLNTESRRLSCNLGFKPPCRFTRNVLLKELSLLRTERIRIFLTRQLIEHYVSIILLTNILTDCRFVHSYCADVIPNTPESTIAVFIFQLGKSVEYHKRAFPF